MEGDTPIRIVSDKGEWLVKWERVHKGLFTQNLRKKSARGG